MESDLRRAATALEVAGFQIEKVAMEMASDRGDYFGPDGGRVENIQTGAIVIRCAPVKKG